MTVARETKKISMLWNCLIGKSLAGCIIFFLGCIFPLGNVINYIQTVLIFHCLQGKPIFLNNAMYHSCIITYSQTHFLHFANNKY